MGTFKVKKSGDWRRCNLKVGNGEVIGTSEVYNSRASCGAERIVEEVFVRRERTVGGKHGHALPPAAVGRTAVERRPYQADFAKCGGGGRVVEAPPRWRLSQLTRPARRAGPTTGGPQFIAADGESGAGGDSFRSTCRWIFS